MSILYDLNIELIISQCEKRLKKVWSIHVYVMSTKCPVV